MTGIILTTADSVVKYPRPTTPYQIGIWLSTALISTYCLTSVLLYVLIRYTKVDSTKRDYKDSVVVLTNELVKLLACSTIYGVYHRRFILTQVMQRSVLRKGVWYAVPAFVYAVYNRLTFMNLSAVDPPTYQVFMQTRILFTGIAYQVFLNRNLSILQWIALLLLTLGVAWRHLFSMEQCTISAVLGIIFQASLSSFAGAFNERLLKDDDGPTVFEQNFFMYLFGSIFSIIAVYIENPNPNTWVVGTASPYFWLIVGISAVLGIVASLIIKYINVIAKTFATASEVMLNGMVAYLLLGCSLTGIDISSYAIIMFSICLYNFRHICYVSEKNEKC